MGGAVTAEWERVVDSDTGFVAWRDPELFEAWKARAAELAARGVALDRAGDFAAQRAAVAELVEAVANCYRACDVPAPCDPAYFGPFLRAANPVSTLFQYAGEPPWGGAWIDNGVAGLYEPKATWETHVDRAHIGWNGATSLGALSRDPDAFMRDHSDGRAFWILGSRPSRDWTQGFVTSACETRGGFLGAGDCEAWRNYLLPPAVWEFWLWSDIQAGLAQRSAWQVQRDAWAWSLAKNLQVAGRYNIAGARSDITRILEAQARRSREQIDADTRAAARGNLTAMDATTALMALGGPVGALFGAVMNGLVRLLIEVLPLASGYDIDVWGRTEPTFTVFRLSGTAAAPPTHDVPAPPGFARKPRGVVKVLLPANIPTARASVDGGESHPSYLERSLPEGLHQLTATAEGYIPTARTVRVVAGREELWRPVLVRATDPAYRAPPALESPGLVVVPLVSVLEVVNEDPSVPVKRRGAAGSKRFPAGSKRAPGGGETSREGEGMGASTDTELTVLVEGIAGAEVLLSPPAPGSEAGAWLSLPRTVRWPRAVSVRLVVRAPGRASRSQDVDINPGEKATVMVNAESLPPARRWLPWVWGGLGALAVGGLVVVISGKARRSDGVL